MIKQFLAKIGLKKTEIADVYEYVQMADYVWQKSRIQHIQDNLNGKSYQQVKDFILDDVVDGLKQRGIEAYSVKGKIKIGVRYFDTYAQLLNYVDIQNVQHYDLYSYLQSIMGKDASEVYEWYINASRLNNNNAEGDLIEEIREHPPLRHHNWQRSVACDVVIEFLYDEIVKYFKRNKLDLPDGAGYYVDKKNFNNYVQLYELKLNDFESFKNFKPLIDKLKRIKENI